MAQRKLKNITLSADRTLVEQARQRAKELNTTLNQAFRDWLEQFTRPASCGEDYRLLMKNLKHITTDASFSRDQLNER